jgi:hypothetical protein
MARGKKAPELVSIGVESAVQDAFSGMQELKDELQEWYDNLPENFQNGSKGEQLQEAMDAIDGVYEVDTPDAAQGLETQYMPVKGRSRAARRDGFVAMLSAAADAARQHADFLQGLEYDEDGDEVDGSNPDAPATEDERDTQVSELETFADEVENAVSEFEAVEFPGMYG